MRELFDQDALVFETKGLNAMLSEAKNRVIV